ncbi:MAG: hypothetical protein ACQES0_04735 [Bacteroidota bacterium]
MPSRKLPQNDTMRYEAMKMALEVADKQAVGDCAFGRATYDELKAMFSRFEQIYQSMEKLKDHQEYLPLQKKARLYITHYLQVMLMAVERGELPENTTEYYGIKPGSWKLPKLQSDKQLIEYGKSLFERDAKRISEGGKYITNPGIAVVKVWFEKYLDAWENHQLQLKKYKNNKHFLEQMRHDANACIKNVWDEVEAAYEHLRPALKRKAAAKYGVMYVESSRERAIRSAPATGSLFNKHDIPEEEPEMRTIPDRKPARRQHKTSENSDNQASLSFVMEERN